MKRSGRFAWWGVVPLEDKTDHRRPPDVLFPTFPKKCKLRFTDLGCGGDFCSLVSTDGKVYSCGITRSDRLGFHDPVRTYVANPTLLWSPETPAKSVFCGNAHSIVIFEDGSVGGFGKADGGCLGLSNDTAHDGSPVMIQFDDPIETADCGLQYTMVVARDGKLYSCGLNSGGRLGRSEDGSTSHVLKEVRFPGDDSGVVDVSCGAEFACAITMDGNIWTWGKSDSPVVPSKKKHNSIPMQHAFGGDSKPVECSCSVGQFHTHLAVRSEDGRVWMIGENYKKKLGIPHADVVEEFQLVPHSVEHRVKSLAMGGIHSGYLGVDGEVFTFGCGSNGRLGHPEFAGHRYLYKEAIPKRVDKLTEMGKEVIRYTSHYYNVAALID